MTSSLVEPHGGRIGVESAPGEGSTYSFAQPVAREAPGPAPTASSGGAIDGAGPNRRVPAVEEPDIVDQMRRYLPRGDTRCCSPGRQPRRCGWRGTRGRTSSPWTSPCPTSTASRPSGASRAAGDSGDPGPAGVDPHRGWAGQAVGAITSLTKPVQGWVLPERIARVLADDDADARAFIAGQLRRIGHQVVEAVDGAEAWLWRGSTGRARR